jgi:hypothetical protein
MKVAKGDGDFRVAAGTSFLLTLFAFFTFPLQLIPSSNPSAFLGQVFGMGFGLITWGSLSLILGFYNGTFLIVIYVASIGTGALLLIESIRARIFSKLE